jgi:hypothetical protein
MQRERWGWRDAAVTERKGGNSMDIGYLTFEEVGYTLCHPQQIKMEEAKTAKAGAISNTCKPVYVLNLLSYIIN